jgi:hypothetical protein
VSGCAVRGKKKAGAMSHFSKSTENLPNTFPLPNNQRQVNKSHREALWKTGKWSKTYILSISGSSKAVQDLTNSKLPRKSHMAAGKVSTVTLFSQGSSGKLLAFEETVKH